MTNPVSLTLQGVSWQLPDGSLLFHDLNEPFDARPTGLVGRNGVGKSVLGRILAGLLSPSSGRCLRRGSVHHLAQQIVRRPGQSLADLAGVGGVLDALQRIEHGSSAAADFDIVGERWDLAQRLQQQLIAGRLGHLRAQTPAAQLSGGEAMRVALIGAMLSGADMLILDEPSNHLDRDSRSALIGQLRLWSGGLIVISHDRELLRAMSCIVELSSLGLRRYGGGYDFYEQARQQQRAQAIAQLDSRKAERQREQRALARQRERLERRQSRGARQAADANQAPILLGLRKQRSEVSGGKHLARQQAAQEALTQRVHEAAQQVEDDVAIVLFPPAITRALPERLAELVDVQLPCATPRLNLSLAKGQRLALVGRNGSGKSTLLKLLAGRIAPVSGRCEVRVETAYLDQHLSTLDAERPVLQQLMTAASASAESELRSRLALLGLDAQRVLLPTRLLSGGEKLKAALALAFYADRPAQLLLLDEPDNHLDLASLLALEAMLRDYPGAFVVASHDEAFLANIAPTGRLQM